MSALDLRVPLDAILEAFGVSATVTRPAPDNTPIATTVMWHTPTSDVQAFGSDLALQEPRRVVMVPRGDVPTLPRGTTVVAAEQRGWAQKTWKVDGLIEAADPEYYRAFLKLTGD